MRGDFAGFFNAADELADAAVGQVVAVYGGDDDVVELHPADGFGKVKGFFGIEGTGRFVEVDVAVVAGAGAGGAHDEEGGGADAEAFADVGAGGFFADGFEIEVLQDAFDVADALPLGGFDS